MIGRLAGLSARQAAKPIDELVAKPTPYGPMLKYFNIETDSGPYSLPYTCPFAFLHYVCVSTPLFQFLCTVLGTALQGRLVIYLDLSLIHI